jgi:hypothetical protein
VCKQLNPQVILATAAGGDLDFKGVITSILSAEGTVEEFSRML